MWQSGSHALCVRDTIYSVRHDTTVYTPCGVTPYTLCGMTPYTPCGVTPYTPCGVTQYTQCGVTPYTPCRVTPYTPCGGSPNSVRAGCLLFAGGLLDSMQVGYLLLASGVPELCAGGMTYFVRAVKPKKTALGINEFESCRSHCQKHCGTTSIICR